MKTQHSVFLGLILCVLLQYSEAAMKRSNWRESFGSLEDQLRALEEAQEVLRGDLASLRSSVDNLASLVSAGLPEDCYSAKIRGSRMPVVKVKPPGLVPRDVRCDQVSEGGGWTVVLARYPARHNHTERENFNRTWKEYSDGFGDLYGEFWIGNEVLHALTNHTPHQLHISLKDWKGNTATGLWNYFRVAGETQRYRLNVAKYQASKSTIGNSLAHHHHKAFSTYDHDNDTYDNGHCAKSYGGGWWYFSCHDSHLTGAALPPEAGGHHAITWRTWLNNTGLKSATMMIRPLPPNMLVIDPATVCPPGA